MVVSKVEDYYCTKCGASLNEQDGFDSEYGVWTCTECGAELYDENMYDGDLYPEVIWYCDDCGAVLNKQSGFSDYFSSWMCSKCGFINTISEDEIYESEEDYERSKAEKAEYENNIENYDYEDCNDYNYDNDCDDDDYYDDNYNEEESDKNHSATQVDLESELEHALYATRGKRIKAFIFNKKKIKIEYASSELIGKNYRDVILLLTRVGFKKVRKRALKDLYIENCHKIYETDNIDISGIKHFEKNDIFPYNSDIIVTYHEKKEVTFPYSSKSVKKCNFKNLKEELQNIGFTNIYEKPIPDLITGWLKKADSIEEVSVAGNIKFKDKMQYPYDEKIIIKYHTFNRK